MREADKMFATVFLFVVVDVVFAVFVVVDVVFAVMPWPSDLISFYGCGFGEKRYQLWQSENG